MNIENKIKTSIEREKLENELSHKKYELENLNEEIAKENKQLRDNIRQMDNSVDKLQKQLIKEKDNWNKLEEFIKDSLEAIDAIQKLTGNAIENYTPRILTYNQIKNKMLELEKGSDSNE